MVLDELLAALEREVAAACREVYGPRLVSVAVFGSVARGEARPDSDIDLILVARDLPRGRRMRVREFEAVEGRVEAAFAGARSEGVDAELAPVFRTPDEALRGSVLFLDMTQDVHLLVDEGGFLASLLDRLRLKLQAMGARRIGTGRSAHWDLKPDFKPGDVVDLTP